MTMNKLRVLLIDDESLARKGLKLRLHDNPLVEIIGECSNGRDALKAVAELDPDLLFLDIQMPGVDGFEVVRRLQPETMPMIIFITAYDEYAIKAFEINAVDYILKPIEDDRLNVAVKRASELRAAKSSGSDKQHLLAMLEQLGQEESVDIVQWLTEQQGQLQKYPEKLSIKEGSERVLLASEDIDWVDAAGDYMCLHAKGQTHVMRITMKELESQLNPAAFQRIHRSTIVNMHRVEKVCAHVNGEFYLVLNSGEHLRMSRRYKEKVQSFFN